MLLMFLKASLLVAIAALASGKGFLPFEDVGNHGSRRALAADSEVFDEVVEALRVMQEAHFEPWIGTWPDAIDWTAAVIGTHVSGALSTLSLGLEKLGASDADDYKAKENLITSYFSQVLGSYFGQDAFSIRNQAYDDILWVVLGWLETIQFIESHTARFYASDSKLNKLKRGVSDILSNQTWHGNLWSPAFAHRSRIFWDLGEKGWDTKLCGGGMNWNPRLTPYKNAITNELFIAASISMYLYFPGDANGSPYNNPKDPRVSDPDITGPSQPQNQTHLESALAAYEWINSVGMMGSRGLYIDGFHISNWDNVTNPGTKCDGRNDRVYTYNQGVILTGQLGLWRVTGDDRFLQDGHKLIQTVIKATGYDIKTNQPVDNITDLKSGELPRWHGLGRAGVLEEQCDVGGTCSQDSQTFKGIFFHHLTTFCVSLDIATAKAAKDLDDVSLRETTEAHSSACAAYVGWIRHNAGAALATRDASGRFGMWWTVGLLNATLANLKQDYLTLPLEGEGVDYRTYGVPNDDVWRLRRAHSGSPSQNGDQSPGQTPLDGRATPPPMGYLKAKRVVPGDASDPNSRGRGRTVETQSGGLALLRALWEISNRAGG